MCMGRVRGLGAACAMRVVAGSSGGWRQWCCRVHSWQSFWGVCLPMRGVHAVSLAPLHPTSILTHLPPNLPLPGASAWLKSDVLGFPLDELLKWALVTPVQFVVGWRFHKGAYKALRRGVANMDVLVSLGTNASYLYSLISVLHHHFTRHHHFGTYTPTVRTSRRGSVWECAGMMFWSGCCRQALHENACMQATRAKCGAAKVVPLPVRPLLPPNRAVRVCLAGLTLHCPPSLRPPPSSSPQDFFETSAMLITFVLLGKYLECGAKGRTSEAIQVGMGQWVAFWCPWGVEGCLTAHACHTMAPAPLPLNTQLLLLLLPCMCCCRCPACIIHASI